jgi:hypothetical protein
MLKQTAVQRVSHRMPFIPMILAVALLSFPHVALGNHINPPRMICNKGNDPVDK